MSALPAKADIRPRDQDVCFGPIVLQKDFGPRSEEHFLQIRPQERSLIQKFGHSDSNIARFWRSGGCRRLLQHNRHKADIAGASTRAMQTAACRVWLQNHYNSTQYAANGRQ